MNPTEQTELTERLPRLDGDPPRCECTHGEQAVRCRDDAVFAVTVVCVAEGCDCGAAVYLLCSPCLDGWRESSLRPGAPRLRVRRL